LWVVKKDRFRNPSVAFSPDGKTIAAGSWDGTIRLFDAQTSAETRVFRISPAMIDGVWSLAFSPKENIIGCGWSSGDVVLISV
jgi:WD40 repeat protein